MKETILDIFAGVMPTAIICTVISVSLRLTYLIRKKQKFHPIQELFMLTFIIYIICLFYAVTFQDIDGSWATSNFLPFKEMFRYSFGSRLFIKNVLGNMLMFIPYGFFSSYFLKEKNGFVIFLLTAILSFSIEYIQLRIGRVFDIDDIILNVVGGLIGYFIYFIFCRVKSMFMKDSNE